MNPFQRIEACWCDPDDPLNPQSFPGLGLGAPSRFRKGFALLESNCFCLLPDPEAGQVGQGAPLQRALLNHQVVDGLGNGDGDARHIAAAALLSHLGLSLEGWLPCHGRPMLATEVVLMQTAAQGCHLRSPILGCLCPLWRFEAIQVRSYKRRCGPLPRGKSPWLGFGSSATTLKSSCFRLFDRLPSTHPPLRCLVVEDQVLMGELLVAMVQTESVVGSVRMAKSVQEARIQIDRSVPDLLILDLALPDGNGQEVALHLLKFNQNPSIILLSAQLQDFKCEPSLLPHILATVEKTKAYKELSHALKELGDSLNKQTERTCLSKQVSKMTPREQDVFLLIGAGNTTRQIAEQLRINSSTVDTHRKAIAQHLGTSGSDLVRQAAIHSYRLQQYPTSDPSNRDS